MSRRLSSALAEHAKLWGLLGLIVVLGLLAAYQFVEPPPPAARVSAAQVKQMEAAWHAMQKDLAGRSPQGELRKATGSGTEIHRQKPELVVQAIQDVWRRSR